MYQKRADADLDVRVHSGNTKLKVSLLIADSDVPVAVKTFESPFTGKIHVSFDLTAKSGGIYRMRAQLLGHGKNLYTSYSSNYPYNPKPKIGFDKYGIMLVDHKPFFPVGIYNLRTRLGTPDGDVAKITEEIMSEAAQAGFNSTVLYDDQTTNLIPLLDTCQRHGIKAFVYPTLPFHKRKGDETPDTIHGDMKARMGHPAVAGWYVVDEPEGIGTAPPRAVRDLYQTIKEYDSDHPCALVVMGSRAAREYRSATDIMWADPYPIPDRPVTLVSDVIAGSVRNIEKDKPMWCIPQAFDWNAYEGKFDGIHRPTPEEERCMTYLALVSGAKGMMLGRTPQGSIISKTIHSTGPKVKRLAGELRDLSAILVTPTIDSKLSVCQSGSAVQTMLKRISGCWYVFAVNSSVQPCETRFTSGHSEQIKDRCAV